MSLIFPTKARIQKMPRTREMDPDFRMPKKSRDQLRREGQLPEPFEVTCQIVFDEHERQDMNYTGDDRAAAGRLVIEAHTQSQHDIQPEDFVVGYFVAPMNLWKTVDWRITHVKPRDQKYGMFQHYHILFGDVAGA